MGFEEFLRVVRVGEVDVLVFWGVIILDGKYVYYDFFVEFKSVLGELEF